MIRRLLFSIALVSLLLIPAVGFAAYDSGICKSGSTCTSTEVGPLMDGISKGCGNLGNCSLDDIMTVFINTGNYVIGVVGAVVLLMYVIGGIYMLTSGGKQERVQKGKKYLTVSTVGMLIVMFAYLGIVSLKGGLIYGDVSVFSTDSFVNCTEDTIGDTCDLNSTCTEDFLCVTACKQKKAGETSTTSGYFSSQTISWQCIDTTEYPDSAGSGVSSYTTGECDTGLCPGDANFLCCVVVDVTVND